MGPFDPPDSPALPPAVRAFAEARRAWVDSGWSDESAGAALERATEALRRELERRGGEWRVGGLIYQLERDRGIGIEQTAAEEMAGESEHKAPAPQERDLMLFDGTQDEFLFQSASGKVTGGKHPKGTHDHHTKSNKVCQ